MNHVTALLPGQYSQHSWGGNVHSTLLGIMVRTQPQDYRRLTLLRETVEAAQVAGTDAVMVNRHVTTLKEVCGNLGSVMAAIDAKWVLSVRVWVSGGLVEQGCGQGGKKRRGYMF